MADLSLVIDVKDLASPKFIAIGKAVIDFARSSTMAFAEQEKADRRLDNAIKQLGYDAAALGPVFRAQAAVMQDALGVSDDMVQGLQTLMLQFGAAPGQIDATTRAVLDYASATGKDAQTATMELMRAVESGTGKLGRTGLEFKATGDKAADLAAAVKLLGERFGGSAAASADSLSGRMEKAKAAYGDFQESVGKLIALLVTETQVLEKATSATQGLTEALSSPSGLWHAVKNTSAETVNLTENWKDWLAVAYGSPYGALNLLRKGLSDTADEAKRVREELARAALPAGGGGGTADAAEKLAKLEKEGQEKLKKAREEAAKKAQAAAEKAREAELVAITREAQWKRSLREEEWKEVEAQDKLAERLRRQSEDVWDIIEDNEKKASARSLKVTERLAKELAAQEEEFRRAGLTVGSAFAGALAGEIEQLMSGGEFDLAGMVAGLLPMLLGLINPALAPVGMIAGGLIRGASRGARRRHDGGWVDDGGPYFHGGGWPGLASDEVPIIAQKGEYVMSRQEVAEAASSPRLAVTINTMDARGVRDFFADAGGRGFRDAIRTGHGDLARVLKGRR